MLVIDLLEFVLLLFYVVNLWRKDIFKAPEKGCNRSSQSKFFLAAGSSCASIEESDFTTANLKALVDGVLV